MTNWNIISSSRNNLMGFAIILIMLYHLGYADIFNIGVDVFLLLSGMGVYYSLNKDADIESFYKKRLVRILPEFMIVSISVSLIYMILDHKTATETIIMASGLSVFFNHSFAFWFIPLILICYLISPVFYRMMSKRAVSRFFFLIAVCLICYILALLSGSAYIVFTRIPVFIIGMLISPAIAGCVKISSTQLGIMAIVSAIGITTSQFLIRLGCDWFYIFISYTIYVLPLTLCLSYLINKFNSKVLPFVGGITLELYLLHESLCIRFANLVLQRVSGFTKLFLCTIVSITFAILLSKLLQYTNNQILKKLWN